MSILALDLGAKMGFAMSKGKVVSSGTVNHNPYIPKSLRLSAGPEAGNKYALFQRWLSAQLAGNKYALFQGQLPAVIYYEKVMNHAAPLAAHAYGAYEGILLAKACMTNTKVVAVPVGTIKKHATGKGNASKCMMIKAMDKQFNCRCKDDNEADALAILSYAMQKESI